MPLQNRVTPLGELVADPARGLVYGNRGCLHDAAAASAAATRERWIACRLEFRGWQRGPMLQPGRFTELFFLDEATAFAAGHRPCALCRRADYNRFGPDLGGPPPGRRGAEAIDARLHAEPVVPGLRGPGCARHCADELPDGASSSGGVPGSWWRSLRVERRPATATRRPTRRWRR